MALKLRGDVYWMDVMINGKRVRESLKTSDKKQALELHDIKRGEIWRNGLVKKMPKKTMGDAFDRWLVEKAGKKSIEADELRIALLRPKLGSKMLSEITREAIDKALPEGIKPATRNRYRALLRAVLRAAERDWEWLERAPIIKSETEKNKRETYITREQADRLLAELPEHYRPVVRFALLTGMRRANVLGLRWERVNLAAGTVYVAPEESKSGKLIMVPLNASAKALLEAQPGREGYVFQCQHITPATWQRACKRAGIEGFRFHDLRHTWASWHAMAGTSLQVLQELGGWSSYSMVQRYVTFAPSHLAVAAEAVQL